MGWAYDYQCNNHATIADYVDDREFLCIQFQSSFRKNKALKKSTSSFGVQIPYIANLYNIQTKIALVSSAYVILQYVLVSVYR